MKPKTTTARLVCCQLDRKQRKGADPDSSYTAHLYSKGIKRIAQKVGEEGVETALAATVKDLEELKNESADLLYHLIVLLQASDLNLSDVIKVLKQRHSKQLSKVIIYSFMQCEGIGMYFEPNLHTNRKNS